MNQCFRCGAMKWSTTRLPTGMSVSVCNGCGQEIEFATSSERKDLSDTDPCPKCKARLFWHKKKVNAKRLTLAYHFCKWLKCVGCHAVFFNEKYKVFPDQKCGCEVSKPTVYVKKEMKRNTEPLKSYLR